MLVCGKVINRLGSVAAGSTVSDYHENERERKISIQASLLHLEWMNKKFNIIDCPGYLDFISESLGALRVADFALIVVDAKDGVGVGTMQVWDWATQFGIPKMFVVNGLDKENTDFDKVVTQIRQFFGDKVFPLSQPLNPGPAFNQVLDVPRSEVITYAGDKSGNFTEAAASGDTARPGKATSRETRGIHRRSGRRADGKILRQGDADRGRTPRRPAQGHSKAILHPAFRRLRGEKHRRRASDGFHRQVRLRRPWTARKSCALDDKDAEAELNLSAPEPVLFVFKTMSEAKFGELSFFRIFSGKLAVGTELYNTDRRSSEKIGQIYVLNGQTREAVDHLSAGDIGATVKLKVTHTGNTLCSPKVSRTLPKIQWPKPNIHAAIELKVKGEEDKLSQGLAALHQADPTFTHTVDGELHQTVLSAQGELHLAVIVDEMKKRYKVEIEMLPPKIRFRETIKGRGDSNYRHKKQTGGAGQFAEVWMRIEPKPRDTGLEFTESLVGQNVDRVFVPSVEKGVNRAVNEGILAGYRVTDVKVDFYDGKMHPVDSKDIAFQIAGYEAFKEAFKAARPVLLEPIQNVEIKVPDEYMGAVMGDLSSRRGKIQGMDAVGGVQVIKAQVRRRNCIVTRQRCVRSPAVAASTAKTSAITKKCPR